MADFLFVQNANRVIYADVKLTLAGVSPATVMFSDRPERIAGQGQGGQLAAGTRGRLHPDAAHVLGQG